MPCGCNTGSQCCGARQTRFHIENLITRDTHLYRNTDATVKNQKAALELTLHDSISPAIVPSAAHTPRTAELDRAILNLPDNYLRKPTVMVQVLDNDLKELKELDKTVSHKTRFIGEPGEFVKNARPPTSPSTTFFPTLKITQPQAHSPIPEYRYDTKIDPAIFDLREIPYDWSTEREFEWPDYIPPNKMSNDRYFGLETNTFTSAVLVGTILAVLLIIPIVPPF